MSIADNIRIGNPDVSNEEIIMALKMSGCEEFIKALPEGIDTVLTEKGNNLSGGQRQRLTIARAIVKMHRFFCLMNQHLPSTKKRKIPFVKHLMKWQGIIQLLPLHIDLIPLRIMTGFMY